MSPLAPLSGAAEAVRSSIITITPAAHAELVGLRDAEPDSGDIGLRLEVVSGPGEPFRYDLSFDTVTTAAFSDEVRTHDGLKVIIPAKDLDKLEGATLDLTPGGGLIIRNPNTPAAPSIEGLVRDDEVSAEIEAILSNEVNPALASHGGFVTYVGHDEAGTAFLTMGGGCHGCAMSRMTMFEGVQKTLVEQVPAIERVKDLTDHAGGENPFYR